MVGLPEPILHRRAAGWSLASAECAKRIQWTSPNGRTTNRKWKGRRADEEFATSRTPQQEKRETGRARTGWVEDGRGDGKMKIQPCARHDQQGTICNKTPRQRTKGNPPPPGHKENKRFLNLKYYYRGGGSPPVTTFRNGDRNRDEEKPHPMAAGAGADACAPMPCSAGATCLLKATPPLGGVAPN